MARRNGDRSRPSVPPTDWLGRPDSPRQRRWALEEQLFGARDEALSEARVLRLHSPVTGLDGDYWLARCHGFAVVASGGQQVGMVEGVRFGSRLDRPDQLEVRTGRLRRRLMLVSVDQVADISGDDELVVLHDDPFARRGLAQELLARARDGMNRIGGVASAGR